jgi:hypothetical protein
LLGKEVDPVRRQDNERWQKWNIDNPCSMHCMEGIVMINLCNLYLFWINDKHLNTLDYYSLKKISAEALESIIQRKI